jgi:hypothetical protein
MMYLLSFFDPKSWLFRIVAALIVAGILMFGWHVFKVAITKPAVEAALVKERAEVKPKIDALTAERDAAKSTIAEIVETSKAESARLKGIADAKTKQYQSTLIRIRDNSAFMVADHKRTVDELNDRLRDITERSVSAAAAGDSGFARRIGAAYEQCERDIAEAKSAAGRANQGLAEAIATIKALQNEAVK